jgi:nucleoside-diphosphate-sugar epimerase
MKILVTGCNGNVGNHLIDKIGQDFQVFGTDLHNSSKKYNPYIQCNICSYSEIEQSFNNYSFDIVIHCAAIAHNDENKFTDDDFWKINFEGTKNLVHYFDEKRINGFIFFSTTAVYGKSGIISERQELNPDTAYAKSKAEAEKFIINNSKSPYLILRFSPIYDESLLNDLRKRVIGKMVLNRQILIKIGNAKQRSSFCHLKNVCDVILFFVQNRSAFNKIYNIGDPVTYSQCDIISYFKSLQKSLVVYIPKILVIVMLRILYFRNSIVFNSFYSKLAEDNIFEIKNLEETGFRSKYSLFN